MTVRVNGELVMGSASETICRAHDPSPNTSKEKAMVLVYDPTAPRRTDTRPAGKKLETLAGKVVGFIDNAKPNFNHLVDDLADLLAAQYGVRQVIKRRKRSASVPAPDEVVRELADQCDLVIAGSGD
jgi:hypothetical protein